VVDTETEALENPQKLWLVVVREIEGGKVHVFRNLHEDPAEVRKLHVLAARCTAWVGHNIIGFDLGVLDRLAGLRIEQSKVVDTLVVSRLLNQGVAGGHSLSAIGERLGCPKGDFKDFSSYSKEMEEYCIQDVEVTYRYYLKIKPFLFSDRWKPSLRLEHDIAFLCQEMSRNGFAFDIKKAKELHREILQKLQVLTDELQQAFPPRSRLIKEVTPRATAQGTLHRGDFRWLDSNDLTPFMVGGSFSRFEFVPFNPGSPKQVVERLNEAGWAPYEKTKGHIQAEREGDPERLDHYAQYGWKVSDNNLQTLPSIEHIEEWVNNCHIKIPSELLTTIVPTKTGVEKKNGNTPETIIIETKSITEKSSLNASMDLVRQTLSKCLLDNTVVAQFVEKTCRSWSIIVTPQGSYVDCSAIIATPTWAGLKNTESQRSAISTNHAARKLVQWLLLDSRRSTLEEWFGAYSEATGRIHGRFHHIGAWTHRMSHSNPNMANIPAGDSPFATEMRSLWCVSECNESEHWLVGVDADGIQLRILAHYMNDKRFTDGLISGRKEEGTDVHSLNRRALGDVCRSRDDAKTFIYAWLLGAGDGKIAQILGCTFEEARAARKGFLEAYPGLQQLKEVLIPADASRGYFTGLDGRAVLCDSAHLMLAGYLQNGESIVMKRANLIWRKELQACGILSQIKQVNFVHDEWQVEVKGDYELALQVAKIQAKAITRAGEELGLRCPLEGSFLNSHKELSIGKNWAQTH